jgi:predicted dehydrogenase
MRFLIAGLGSIGRRHLRNLLALGERDIVLYRTHLSTLPDDELSGFPVETDPHAALQHKPEAVIVSNPTALHLDIAIPAARAGCSLMLEKPVSHTLDRVSELQEALRAGGGRCLVGYHYRFNPGLQQTACLIDQGAIGRPLWGRAHWGEYLPDWHPWEDYRTSYSARPDLGGGVILTLSHTLDYMGWLLGQVDSVCAFTSRSGELELEVEDTAEIGLRFQNGVIGSVHMNYHQRPASHWMEIGGTSGLVHWDNASGQLHLYRGAASQPDVFSPPPGFERNDMFLAQTRHFIQVVRGESQPVCSLEDGLQALRLSLAALASAESGSMVSLV